MPEPLTAWKVLPHGQLTEVDDEPRMRRDRQAVRDQHACERKLRPREELRAQRRAILDHRELRHSRNARLELAGFAGDVGAQARGDLRKMADALVR